MTSRGAIGRTVYSRPHILIICMFRVLDLCRSLQVCSGLHRSAQIYTGLQWSTVICSGLLIFVKRIEIRGHVYTLGLIRIYIYPYPMSVSVGHCQGYLYTVSEPLARFAHSRNTPVHRFWSVSPIALSFGHIKLEMSPCQLALRSKAASRRKSNVP